MKAPVAFDSTQLFHESQSGLKLTLQSVRARQLMPTPMTSQAPAEAEPGARAATAIEMRTVAIAGFLSVGRMSRTVGVWAAE